MHNSLSRVVAVVSLAASLLISFTGVALAHTNSSGRCVGCHTAATDKETTAPTTVDALPGQPVAFTIQVTNAGVTGTRFATAFTGKGTSSTTFTSLDALPGDVNPLNVLAVPADAGWTLSKPGTGTGAGKTYYTDEPAGGWQGSYSKTFAFTVPAGTPADTYHMVLKVAGVDATEPELPVRWAQSTDVYLNVGRFPSRPRWRCSLVGRSWDWSAGGGESIRGQVNAVRQGCSGSGTVPIFAVGRERDGPRFLCSPYDCPPRWQPFRAGHTNDANAAEWAAVNI